MRNRKRLKLNIILLVALAIAGIIFFVMFEDKEETSIVGATKVYDIWIGFDGASTSHGAQYSLEADPNWLCCDHGSPLPGWAKSLSTNDTVDGTNFDKPYMEIEESNGVITVNWTTKEFGKLDLATTKSGDEPETWGFHTYREPEPTSVGFGFTQKEYKFTTFGDYSGGGNQAATPMEAYILGHISENTGYPSEVQQAWWATSAGGGTRSTVMMEWEWHLQLENLKIMLYQLQDQQVQKPEDLSVNHNLHLRLV